MSDEELKAIYQDFAAAIRAHTRVDWQRQRELGIDRTDRWRTIRKAHRTHIAYLDREIARVLNDLTKQEQGRE